MNCHSLIPNDSFQTFLHLLLFQFFCCFCSSCTSICCSMGKQSGSSAGKQKLLLSKHSKLLEMRDSVSQGKDFPLEKGAGNSSPVWIFPKEPAQGFIPFLPKPTGNFHFCIPKISFKPQHEPARPTVLLGNLGSGKHLENWAILPFQFFVESWNVLGSNGF